MASAPPEERRHPRVTIQDLRRDLREADEDRYRLVERSSDYRRPRVSVQQLRRDLRDADRDRFGLRMRLQTAKKTSGVGLLLCFTVVASIGLWCLWNTSNASNTSSGVRQSEPQVSAVDIDSSAASVVVTDTQVGDSNPAVRRSNVATGHRGARSGTTNRPAAKRPLESAPAPTPIVTPTHMPSAAPPPTPTREIPRRAVLRPLHPGEFGRKTQL